MFPMNLLAVSIAATLLGGTVEDNLLLQQLIKQGVILSNGERLPIAAPSLPDGLDGEAQKAIVAKLARRYDWSLFTRRSHVAPFADELTTVETKGKVKVSKVDVWFVAHGRLGAILSDQGLQKFLGTSETDKNNLLDAAELKQRKIAQPPDGKETQRHSVIESRLIDKVMISGVLQSTRTQSDQSVVLAWEMDRRFNGDATLPNLWRPITRDAQLGEGKVYSAYAAYAKITALKVPGLTDALFVEIHWLFEEPYAWFNGRPLLRSKLPIAIQSNVRGFRRGLTREPAPSSGSSEPRESPASGPR